jgi:hypothetical protein
MMASLDDDRLGMATKAVGDRILFSYPALILASRRDN